MKKMLLAAAAGAIALSLASCGGGSDCTTDALQKKGKDLQDAMTAALTKDPAKAASNAQAWSQKAQDLMAKAQAAGSSPTAEVCKAYDDLINTVKQ